MPTSAAVNFSGGMLLPFENPDEARLDVLNLAQGSYSKGQLIGEKIGNAEVQTVTITGTPTGGNFTLTFNGQTTANIPFNATATQVRQALEALTNIGVGGVTVTGGPGPGTPFVVTFVNQADVAQMTTANTFTGGTTPASAVSTTTAGSAGTPGTFAAYDVDNTDGSQVPTHILQYACTVDASGNITLGDTAGGEWGVTIKGAPAYRCGTFHTGDLVGLDGNAMTLLRARLTRGTLANGVVMIPGA